MTEDNNSVVEPCPFCDGAVHRRAMSGVEGCFHIAAPHCPVESHRMMTIEQWNTRTLAKYAQPTEAMIDAGVAELENTMAHGTDRKFVTAIYIAMSRAAPHSIGEA